MISKFTTKNLNTSQKVFSILMQRSTTIVKSALAKILREQLFFAMDAVNPISKPKANSPSHSHHTKGCKHVGPEWHAGHSVPEPVATVNFKIYSGKKGANM